MNNDTIGKRTYAYYEGGGKETGPFPLVEGMRVLEIGFGSGKLLEALRERGNDVYGVDTGQRIVEHAKQAGFPHVFLVDVSEEYLPFGAAFFDAVYCYEVFEHLTNPYRMFCEIRRVLRQDGLLYFSIPAQEFDMGYGVDRHTFVYPGLMERKNIERFFMQMYFRIESSMLAKPGEWLAGHSYMLRNIHPQNRKDVMDVIIGDYSIRALYQDVLTPEALREEIDRELSVYEQRVERIAQSGQWTDALQLLTFVLKHYPDEYSFYTQCAHHFHHYGRFPWIRWLFVELFNYGDPPHDVIESIQTIMQKSPENP